jgi:hypothetical protein
MATQPPRRKTTPKRPSGGGGWFLLFLVVVIAGAVFVLAPEKVREIFGKIETPGEGAAPTTTQSAKTDLNERESANAVNLGEPSKVDRSLPDAPKAIKSPPAIKAPIQKLTDYSGEKEAQAYLKVAEDRYKTFDWAKARSGAQKVLPLDAKPATKVRAKDILRGADTLEKLFAELNTRDELSRNYDTNPGLVVIKSSGEPSFAVPIRSMDDQTVVESGGLQWLNSQRSATGKIAVLLKGHKDFMAATLPADTIGSIEAADLTRIQQEKQDEFNARLGRLRGSDMVKDAMSWYDAGKFAFRNRLDEHVTDMMDHAIVLDPMLAQTVREDKAGTLFANVVLHMKNGNTKQAAAFMAIINKSFAETESGKQAKLFYEGKSSEMLAARKESERLQREDEQKRRDARLARAQELGDQETAAAIAKEPERAATDDAEVEMLAGPVSGSGEAAADDFFDKGRDLYQKAIESGNSDARDSLYGQACDQFTKAQSIYNKLLEKDSNNTGLEEKAFLCNKLRYGSIKQRRFH